MTKRKRRRGDSLVKRAREHIAGGEGYDAREVLFKLMDKYPERVDREVDLLMARSVEVDGRIYKAEEWTRIILEEHPDYLDAWDFLACLLAEMEGRIEELEQVVSHVLELDPNYIFIKRTLGYSYRDADRTQDAMRIFQEIADAMPDCSHAWDCLAHEQREAGLYQEALESWKKALELDPDDSITIHRIKSVEKHLENHSE
jgi:tetratricopeptide (TPR) repeat protein